LVAEDSSSDQPTESAVPDSLVGSGGVFERGKGIHLLPAVSAAPDVLPPSAALKVQQPTQSQHAKPSNAPASTGSDNSGE
jgi:hypothetical protein